ncbi:hypothetical protein ACWPKS_15950 [Coraliomargarita sp. W4R72]
MTDTNVTVNDADVRVDLTRLVNVVDGPQRQGLMQVLGKTHEQTLQGHFLTKNKQPNKRGWKKQNFWARIRRATAYQNATNDTANITIADPAIASKIYGATIKPRRSKFLAIPIREEAYGIRPSSGLIPDLFFLPRKKGGGFLARRNADGSNRLYYFLTRSVKVPKDPTALPTDSQSLAPLTTAAADYVTRQAR